MLLFFRTCRYGNYKAAQLILENGGTTAVRDSKGMTPLHLACQNKHLEVVKVQNHAIFLQVYSVKTKDFMGCTSAILLWLKKLESWTGTFFNWMILKRDLFINNVWLSKKVSNDSKKFVFSFFSFGKYILFCSEAIGIANV